MSVKNPDKKPSKFTVGVKLPRSSGISEQHLYSAYVYGSTRQQRRIETWGRMSRRILRSIGKPAKKDGTQLTDRCADARKEKAS